MKEKKIQLNMYIPADMYDTFEKYIKQKGYKFFTEEYRDHIRNIWEAVQQQEQQAVKKD